jgi:nitrous oxidase accessory protein
MTLVPLVLIALQVVAGAEHAAPPAANLEGRPSADAASPLQARIDAAPAGATIDVSAGVYPGDLIIEKRVRLIGHGRPRLVGSGEGSVVRIRADDVIVEGFEIDGRGRGDLGRDPSGIHVAARRVTVRDCVVRNTLFGIYLRQADGAVVERSVIRGVPGKDPGERGSGIHVWNTNGFTLAGNDIRDVRDGIYIQSSPHGRVAGNTARDLRYGLHYMFSDDNTFEDNAFENGAAGTALMYSRRLTFRRNRFVRNRGFASVGLLFKSCDDVLAEDNFIADNARGIFIEGSYRTTFRGNVVAQSDVAIVLYDSTEGAVFEGNTFIANLTPLLLIGRRTDARVTGNYWSENTEPDLDGDGRSDRPYRLSSVFDHLRGNLTAADLFAQGLGARALGMAERTFPVLDLIPVVDASPLARPPAAVMAPDTPEGRPSAAGAALSAALALSGLGVLAGGRRRETRS